MSHSHEFDPAMLSAPYWDERYSSVEQVWSGRPNPQLVAEVSALAPGAALDVGAGEGADAIWLAGRGWTVTAIDISQVALDRAAQHAAQAGAEVAARITWQVADLLAWTPPAATYDLVSAQFFHLPPHLLAQAHQRLADAVRTGGQLLIVLHHSDDIVTVPRPFGSSLFPPPEEIVARFPQDDWEVVTKAAPTRAAVDAEGREMVLRDAVVRLRRR